MAIQKLPMIVDGKRVESVSAERIESSNPFNQQVWSTIPDATAEDVERAYDAAGRAFETWKHTSGSARGELMLKLADRLVQRAEPMSRTETIDNGKVIRETHRQMFFAAKNYRFLAGYADKIYGHTIPLDKHSLFDYTLAEPAGVAGLLVAWNSPIQLLTNKLAPALCAGCTVVIKPSEHASATTIELVEMALEVGFPPGVINVITGGGRAGQAMARSRKVNKLSFTGGPVTGSLIAQEAAKNLVPVTLELGGKSPHIIFADADLNAAIPGAIAGIFGAAGQSCISGSRLLVQRSIYDRVVDELASRARAIRLGDPLETSTEMGPVANRQQYDRILRFIDSGRNAGARVVAGGGASDDAELRAGYFITPTVFADVSPDMEIAQEEIFGPVLSVLPFDDDDDAIRIANGTQYGLASGLWTRDLSRAHKIARRLEAGTVWINTYRTNAAQAPFGGVKNSGYGRERGLEAVREYLHVKNVMIDLESDIGDPFSMRV